METNEPNQNKKRNTKTLFGIIFLSCGFVAAGFLATYVGKSIGESDTKEEASTNCVSYGLQARFDSEYRVFLRAHGFGNYSALELFESYLRGIPTSYKNLQPENKSKHPQDHNAKELTDAANRGRAARSELEKTCSI